MKTQKFNGRALSLAVASILAVGVGAFSVNSYAATATSTLAVTATVAASCTMTGGTLPFGSFNVMGAAVDAQTTFTATCTAATPYVIGLNAGSGVGATTIDRKMTRTAGGTETLNYSLFSDTTRLANWGNGTTVAAGELAGTGSGVAQTITVYGRIPAGQTSVPAASYADTITATVNY